MVSFRGSNYNSHFARFGTRAEQAQKNGWGRGLTYDEEKTRREEELHTLVHQHPHETDKRLMQEANWKLNHWRFAPITELDIYMARLAPKPPSPKPTISEPDSEDELPKRRVGKRPVLPDSDDEDKFPVNARTLVKDKKNPFLLDEDSESELLQSSSRRLRRGRRDSTSSVKKDEIVPSGTQTLVPNRKYFMLSSQQQESYDRFIQAIEKGDRKAVKEILTIYPSFLRQPDSEGIPPVIAVIHSSQPALLQEFLAHPDITLQNIKVGKYTPPMWPEINRSLGQSSVRQFIDTHKLLLEYHQQNPTHWDYNTIASGKRATDYIDEAVKSSKLTLTVNQRKEIEALKAHMQATQ